MIDPTESDIGRLVIYRSGHGLVEEGIIMSMNESYVFVRYGDSIASKATARRFLDWAIANPLQEDEPLCP